jgi:hypothetical protein
VGTPTGRDGGANVNAELLPIDLRDQPAWQWLSDGNRWLFFPPFSHGIIPNVDAEKDILAAQALIHSLRPSPDVLLNAIRPQIDDSMLQEIAEADYGDDAYEHRAALQQIRDSGKVFAPIEWVPAEVLELIRWSQPEDPNWKPGSTGIRGHWMRAFSCAALLRMAGEPENSDRFGVDNQTMAPLVESSLILGREVCEAAVGFLAWRFSTLPPVHIDEPDRPFCALAILLLTVHLFREGDDSQRILDLVTLIETEEIRIRRWQDEHDLHWEPEDWLLGLTNDALRHDLWRSLARQVLLDCNRPLPDEVRLRVQVIGKRLLGVIPR